ncbi:hypothetical protein BC830DRAFT_762762 [Chytriomyces sp. MP71]|nr:hypothetical protein BC830DRAFT_762762 [Chytriomyces sp. MP71]
MYMCVIISFGLDNARKIVSQLLRMQKTDFHKILFSVSTKKQKHPSKFHSITRHHHHPSYGISPVWH